MRFGVQTIFLWLVVVFYLNSTARARPAGARISPDSGKSLCSALAPSDFTRAGVPVAALRAANLDDKASAYCVYESKAGRVEFDIFYPAGETADAAKGREEAVLGEVGGDFKTIKLAGADSADINLAVPGRRPSASIVVRRRTAVFTIDIPSRPSAREQLRRISETVLAHLEH